MLCLNFPLALRLLPPDGRYVSRPAPDAEPDSVIVLRAQGAPQRGAVRGRSPRRRESADVERMTARAADAAEMFITSGIGAVMNAFNGGDPATTE